MTNLKVVLIHSSIS